MMRGWRPMQQRLCTMGAVLLVAALAGLGFYGWKQYRLGQLQGYEARLEVPLTARADIMPLYSRSPFRGIEIEFPVADIAERYVLRVWVPKEQDPVQVEAELKQFLGAFYASSQTRIDMRLSSMEVELRALQAEQHAKLFEADYLQRNYVSLRAQRIEQLQEDARTLGAAMESKRHVLMAAQGINSVSVQSFAAFAPQAESRILALQSLLVALFVALLQVLWLQRKTPPHAAL
uniref:Uncharacterized protein n=1 Tax=Curvibacter symbiont subsp. Hydra magnipapillata TaxID=667019 RepID=C9YDJ8_CURXX|nr:hypothetical protein Csp_F36950 [Curvibacter putative symbiont of Hydra magnipapillata]